MAKKPTNSGWAKLIGHGFAHLQNGIDEIVDIGFTVMKKVGDDSKDKPAKDTDSYGTKAGRLAKGALRFFGTMGDSYYKKYEELKAEKKL